MQEFFLKIRYFERGLSKCVRKVNFILSFEPVSFNGQNHKKGSGTSDQSLFRLQNKFRKTPLLVMYYLAKFDDVIYKVVFENSENSIHKVMQVSS